MRLIDADALIKNNGLESATKYGNKSAEQLNRSYSTMMLYEIEDMIDCAPTVDAEPVKHGRWIDDHDFAICSLCDRIIYDAYYEFRDKNDASFHNYCPYCGAKMDGGSE